MKLAAALFLVVLISGCASMQTANQSNETVRNDYTNQSANVATGASRPDILESGYSGTVLAGSVSPVIEFNMNDYQAAAGSNKIILLYFYANWCPVCRAEVPEMYSAFSEVNDARAIAFRVNFNDDQTDSNEVEMARLFGVPYQHTKVIVKNGQVQLKSTESWNKNRYLFEINKALSMP